MGMRRRHFLASSTAALASAILAACTRSADDLTADPSSAASTAPGARTTTESTSLTQSSEPTPQSNQLPGVEPLPSPPSPLGPDGFSLGVASGDPDDTSIVLWTRLVGELPETVEAVWEVATGSEFDVIVATGLVSTTANYGHSVHVIADGLTPGGRWWYRFRSGEQTSPTGITRTMPASGDPHPVRIGASSCQLRETGYWAAHEDLAATELTLFCWLGDYIYERGENGTVETLEEYRSRYIEYRSDPLIQASHAAHPWFVLWDDHEVLNDYDATVDPARRAAAYQAWWEFMPVRLPAPATGAASYDIFRTIELGDRVRLVGTDVRQYADGTTLFGEAQKVWLAEQLENSANWTLLASPVVASGIYTGEDDVLLPYTLDGYPEERKWLGNELGKQPGRVIVSGDLHTSAVFEFSPDRRDVDSPVVATEFMAPAISSAFPEQYAAASQLLPLLNSHMAHFQPYNGWLLMEFGAEELRTEFRRVDDVGRPDSSVGPAQQYRVVLGDPEPVEL